MELQCGGLILTSEYAGYVTASLLQIFIEENDKSFIDGFKKWFTRCEGWELEDLEDLCSFLNQKAMKVSKGREEWQAWYNGQWGSAN